MPDPVEQAISLHDRAAELVEEHRLDEAEIVCRQALWLMEEADGPGSPDFANLRNTLAEILLAGARFQEAGDAAAASVAIMEQLPDALNDADCARVYLRGVQLKGVALRSMGSYGESGEWAQRALELAERFFGGQAVETAWCLNEIGILGKFTGRFEEAEQAYHRALPILECICGTESGEVATLLHNLGGLTHARGDFAAGEEPARRAYEIRVALLGEDHPQTMMDAVALAGVLDGLERFGESEPLYRRALKVYEQTYGPEHYEVAATLHNLGSLKAATGYGDEAVGLLRRSIAIKVVLLDESSPDTALGRMVLAQVLLELGRPGEALVEFSSALPAMERELAEGHPQLALAEELGRAIRKNLSGA
jgi:tetratricopeptide (TPR) repeat protein